MDDSIELTIIEPTQDRAAELQERMLAIKEQMDAAKRDYMELSAEYFREMCANLFEDSRLVSFSWTQYTPYFNDGEECEFGVNCDWPYVNDVDFDDRDETTFEDLFVTIRDFLWNIDADAFRDSFGDHCRVTVTRTGVTVEEYRHD